MLECLFNTDADLQVCNFIEKRLQHKCFLNIAKSWRTTFFSRTSPVAAFVDCLQHCLTHFKSLVCLMACVLLFLKGVVVWPWNELQLILLVCSARYPASIYLFKVNNRSTRAMCEICSKLTLKKTTTSSRFSQLKKKKKNFMALFYGWGSTASRLQPLRGGSLLFTIQFPEIPGTYLYCQLWRDFTHCSCVSVVDLEQVNASWVTISYQTFRWIQYWNSLN